MAKNNTMKFSDFQVGDSATFSRTFSNADFKAFSKLSGDKNPLHCDVKYASGSQFGKMIVPVHMTMAPLSMVSGMIMPGVPSLYLGHEVRALKPVFYDEKVSYSARIFAVHEAERILEINVIAFREGDAEILLEARMRVQARHEEWEMRPSDVSLAPRERLALITGSNGAIGSAVAKSLAADGWNLLLQHRGKVSVIKSLRDECMKFGVQVTTCSADLGTHKGREKLEKQIGLATSLEAIVHTASPPVLSDAETQIAINYSALKSMSKAALPGMMKRQRGRLIMIGSNAVQNTPKGWEDYAAAKAMAASYLTGVDREYVTCGVHGVTLAPGYVLSPFSDELRPENCEVLLPEEVAEKVVEIAGADMVDASYITMTPGNVRKGRFAFHENKPKTQAVSQHVVGTGVHEAQSEAQRLDVAGFVRSFLKLPAEYDMNSAELGQTPGWDSLRHLELVLAIEQKLGISFTSGEIASTHRFDQLEQLCANKIGG